jgi:hypothetical protein
LIKIAFPPSICYTANLDATRLHSVSTFRDKRGLDNLEKKASATVVECRYIFNGTTIRFFKKNKGSIRDSVKASDKSSVKISCFIRCNLFLPVHAVTAPSCFYKSSVSNGNTRTRSLSSCNLLWYELNVKLETVMCTQNKVLTNRREYYVANLNRQCCFYKLPQFTDMLTRNT